LDVVAVGRDKRPGGRKVERDYAHAPGLDFLLQPVPVSGREAAKAVHLFDQKHIARLAVREEPEQLRPFQGRAAFVLNVAGGNRPAARGGEGAQLVLGAGRVLFLGAGAEVGSDKHGGGAFTSIYALR